MGRQTGSGTLYLGTLIEAFGDREVQARHGRCGAALGTYIAGKRLSDDALPILAEPGAFTRVERGSWGSSRNRAFMRGPRTQAGLSVETWEGRSYIRIKCTCGTNEKLSLDKLGRLPVSIHPDGSLTVVV